MPRDQVAAFIPCRTLGVREAKEGEDPDQDRGDHHDVPRPLRDRRDRPPSVRVQQDRVEWLSLEQVSALPWSSAAKSPYSFVARHALPLPCSGHRGHRGKEQHQIYSGFGFGHLLGALHLRALGRRGPPQPSLRHEVHGLLDVGSDPRQPDHEPHRGQDGCHDAQGPIWTEVDLSDVVAAGRPAGEPIEVSRRPSGTDTGRPPRRFQGAIRNGRAGRPRRRSSLRSRSHHRP